MKDRKDLILQAIVQSFIETATPVGSKTLKKVFAFPFSSATIRNEMSDLEQEGFLESPHFSAGRIPTDKGYRFFVANCYQDIAKEKKTVEKKFKEELNIYLKQKKTEEKIFDTIAVLNKLTPNVSFATIPHSDRMFFLGLSNAIKEPEFSANPSIASGVFRILESNFHTVLSGLDIADEPKIFIGNENVIKEITSCSLIVSSYKFGDSQGFLGILGPMRMDYALNISAVQIAKDFLEEKV